MRNLRGVMPGFWIAAALSVALPASASGVVTIGNNLVGPANNSLGCIANACTVSAASLPATSQAPGGLLAPSDGVVVRWRIKVGDETTPVALRITRPGGANARTGVGTGPTENPPANQTSTFDVRLPIQTGDAVGINCCDGATMEMLSTTTGAINLAWTPALVDGALPSGGMIFPPDTELLVNADIEPDADGDGFGDETQDECPTDASTQAECDPPETEITRAPSNKSSKPQAKYKFTSSEPDSTFECKLKGKGLKNAVKRFADCDSPRKYKGLDEGKFKFQVRAIDLAGNVDPTPAKDKFKVVD